MDGFDLDLDLGDLDLSLDADTLTDTPPIDYPGDLVGDAKAEVTALQRDFRARMKAENQRRATATDSEYWCCPCFQSRAQVQAFLAALGFDPDTKYIDGEQLARRLNIVLPVAETRQLRVRIDDEWAKLAL